MATVIEIRERVGELRQALDDVVPGSYVPIGFAASATKYQQLFQMYLQALRTAKADAEQWWQRMVEVESARIGDEHEAEVNVEMRRPAGSAVSPRVVHVFREAWLACDRLNRERKGEEEQVHPFELTVDWLLDERYEDLAEYVSSLPFLPIALADDGKWV